jgi:murein DD-endopeptidase MepM/ murein hydrolase activator NlpD
MKNNFREWKSKSKNHVRMWILSATIFRLQWTRRLKEYISVVPVALLLVLALGFAYGIGFYTKSFISGEQFTGLEANMQFTELQSLRMSNEWLKNRVAVLQEERAVLLDTANKNSGGPFTSSVRDTGDELILRTDQYLNTIQDVPLGAPVPGVLTSRFGWRNDPINGKRAYHRGVDIRGKKGSDVKATANGIVKIENYDRRNGRYILVDHGNGFVTKYAHMKKSLVKRGDTVARGQVIGLVGSTGRSTGPHVIRPVL